MLLLLLLTIRASAVVVESAKWRLLACLPPARCNRILFPSGSPGTSISTPLTFLGIGRLPPTNHNVRQAGGAAARLAVGRRFRYKGKVFADTKDKEKNKTKFVVRLSLLAFPAQACLLWP